MGANHHKANRGHLIYLFAIPLLPAFFALVGRGETPQMTLYGGVIAMFFFASYAVRRGVSIQQKLDRSRYRRVWTSAWVGVGGLLAAAGCFVCQRYLVGSSFSMACMLALTAFVGCYLCYGAVRSELEINDADGYSSDEIAKALMGAEDELHVVDEIAGQLEPGDIQQRLKRISRKSGNVLRQIEADPSDLRRARKFLNVFLPGTREVCETYWKVHQSGSTDQFERRFRSTLAEVENLIERQIQKLKDNEEFDLDVQMEVLKTQINEEI